MQINIFEEHTNEYKNLKVVQKIYDNRNQKKFVFKNHISKFCIHKLNDHIFRLKMPIESTTKQILQNLESINSFLCLVLGSNVIFLENEDLPVIRIIEWRLQNGLDFCKKEILNWCSRLLIFDSREICVFENYFKFKNFQCYSVKNFLNKNLYDEKSKKLDLSFKNIKDFNVLESFNLKNEVEEINLEGNFISNVDLNILKDFRNLKKLNLNNNKISNFMNYTEWTTNSISLYLSENNITKLERCFYINKFETLDLSKNEISVINEIKAKNLILSENNISTFSSCYFYEKLDLSKNPLKKFNGCSVILNLSNTFINIHHLKRTQEFVKVLNLNNCNLRSFVGNFSLLEELNLEKCQLESFEAEAANLKKLKVRNNFLDKVPELYNLEFLDISGNFLNIVNISELFSKLKYLDISRNEIVYLKINVCLEACNACNNQIIHFIGNDKNLILEKNELELIPCDDILPNAACYSNSKKDVIVDFFIPPSELYKVSVFLKGSKKTIKRVKEQFIVEFIKNEKSLAPSIYKKLQNIFDLIENNVFEENLNLNFDVVVFIQKNETLILFQRGELVIILFSYLNFKVFNNSGINVLSENEFLNRKATTCISEISIGQEEWNLMVLDSYVLEYVNPYELYMGKYNFNTLGAVLSYIRSCFPLNHPLSIFPKCQNMISLNEETLCVGMFSNIKKSKHENKIFNSPVIVFFSQKQKREMWKLHCKNFLTILKSLKEPIYEFLDRYNGVEIEREMDFSIFAFDSADNAVFWATSMLKHLKSEELKTFLEEKQIPLPFFESFCDGLNIGIDMGNCSVHTDKENNVKYFGPTMNKAARLCYIESAYNLIISSRVCNNISKSPDGFVIKNLGLKELKGFSNRENVYGLYIK